MAEFKSASLWMKVCVLLMPLAHLLHLVSLVQGSGKTGTYACQVTAFLFILVALLLIFCIVFLDECQGDKIAKIFFIIFAIIGGLVLIIAVAMSGAQCVMDKCAFRLPLAVVGALLAILSGVFAIMDLVGCKGAKITVSVS